MKFKVIDSNGNEHFVEGSIFSYASDGFIYIGNIDIGEITSVFLNPVSVIQVSE